jgi:glycopeptide antibiotics resistance protein
MPPRNDRLKIWFEFSDRFKIHKLMEMQIVINNMGIPIWPIGILVLIAVLAILRRRLHSLPYLAFFSIFWVYIMVGLDKTLFPIQINGTFVDVMRQAPLFSQVNLMPFYFSKYGLSPGGYFGILDNILLTIPFGFGLNFIRRLRPKDILWLSFAVGFGIESVQMLVTLILRYPYRVVDINDVWLNAVGVLIGYGLFRIFAWLYLLAVPHRPAFGQSGLLAFIYVVADRSRGQAIR